MIARFSGVRFDVAFMPREVREHYPAGMDGTLQQDDDVAFFTPVYAAEFGGGLRPQADHYVLMFARVVEVKVGKTVTYTLRTVDGEVLRKRRSTLERLSLFRVAREGETVLSYGESVTRSLTFGSQRVA